MNVSHDASHMAFSSHAWVNELCAFAACPMLYEPTVWYYLHVISHHVHTTAELETTLADFLWSASRSR